jgi:PH (Pleckstrin Homology) domain-containing protein
MSVYRYLGGGEEVLKTFRHHWIVLWRPASWSGVAAVAALFMQDYWWIVTMPALVYMGWHLLQWRCAGVTVTTQRIVTVNGLVAQKIGTIPLGKVTDTQYVQTVLGRLLGYGSVVVDLPGQDGRLPRLRRLANSKGLYDLIVMATIGTGGSGGDGGDERRERGVGGGHAQRPRRRSAHSGGTDDPGDELASGLARDEADRLAGNEVDA